MRKHRETKAYRALARSAAEDLGVDTGPWDRVGVFVTFYHSVARRRDDVNALASLKAAYDGLVDAGLLVDDSSGHLKTEGCAFMIDRAAPRVELFLRRL